MNHAGLLDLPGPLLGFVDAAMAALQAPALLRVLLWGALGGALSMAIYRRTSPQQRLAALRAELAELQPRIVAHDGEFAELRGLIARQLSLALRQLGLTLGPALLGALPLFLLLPWLSQRFGSIEPAVGAPVAVCAEPASVPLHWQPDAGIVATDPGCWRAAWPTAAAPRVLLAADGRELLRLPLPAPSDVVAPWHPLNGLMGNPAGYLPAEAGVDAVHLALPTPSLLPWGPAWLRGWEAPFFFAVFAASLALKRYWRVL